MIWDADNHLYEAVDAYTRHLPKRFRGAVQWVQIDGRTMLMIKGKLTDTIPNPTYEVVPTLGAWADYFKGHNPESKSLRELAQPIRCLDEFRHPAERLALLDRQCVDGCVLFPATGDMLEERMLDDIELTQAVVHVQRVAARGPDVRLRGTHPADTDHQPRRRDRCRRRGRLDPREGRPLRARESASGRYHLGTDDLDRTPAIRSLWRRVRRRASRC